MRASGVCWWGKRIFQQSIPTLPAPGKGGTLQDIPAGHPCLPLCEGTSKRQTQVWAASSGSSERMLPSQPLPPARLGRVFGVPLVAPLGMDVRSAGVKQIAVINVTKNNPELSNLVPGMVWAFLEMQPLRSAWVLSILKCYWSLTFPNQFFSYTTGIKWSEPLHCAILGKFFLNHCHFGLFHSSFLTLKRRGMSLCPMFQSHHLCLENPVSGTESPAFLSLQSQDGWRLSRHILLLYKNI